MGFITQVPENRDLFENYKHLVTGFWPNNAFFIYRTATLDACVQKFPLNPEAITSLLERTTVKFDDRNSRCHPDREPKKWVIIVNDQLTLEEKRLDFLHEVGHAYYRARGAGFIEPRYEHGNLSEGGMKEAILDQSAKDCYAAHKEFVDEIFEKLQMSKH